MLQIIGIDPGASGGIAAIHGDATYVSAIPETEHDTCDLLRSLRMGEYQCHAYIEKVHAFPGQGVASMFKFGRGYGFLRGCLVALGIPFEEVSPAVWQRDLKCLSKGDKNVTKAMAQRLFPNLTVTHHVADALLIAEWGRRQRQGQR